MFTCCIEGVKTVCLFIVWASCFKLSYSNKRNIL